MEQGKEYSINNSPNREQNSFIDPFGGTLTLQK